MRPSRRDRLKPFLATLLFLSLTGCAKPLVSPKVIVLGVDGMDPGFVENHWRNLPNLASLRDRGAFRRLETTVPPQSPVAWSTFITGLDPNQHGIFDFVHRDRKTLEPFSSTSELLQPAWKLALGSYQLPLSRGKVISLRKGTPFWKVLSDGGFPVTVIHMPTNYPPVGAGYELSGMGTPDLRGTLGTFTFYTDDPDETNRPISGGEIVKVEASDSHVVLPLRGPLNDLRRTGRIAEASLAVDIDRNSRAARFSTGTSETVLRESEWSGWLSAEFVLIPRVSSIQGQFRVYAKQLSPRIEIYVSALNVDPVAPALPVSAPYSWSRDIARETGRFFTLGTPEDTAAYRQGVLTLEDFRCQTRLVLEDERKLFRYSLERFHGGFLFFYFSSIDQNSHMLWGKYDAQLTEVYSAVDELVGEAMRAHPDADLVVMSDHGFSNFDRAVHLNSWLRDRGFLAARAGAGDNWRDHVEWPVNVEWSRTDAYALGLNGLYLTGKENRRKTMANLREQLLSWRDPENGRRVVENLIPTKPDSGNAAVAPDLIVGYARGYRASWQTALGGIPPAEIENNTDAWIADHCIDAAEVPGVLFANRGLRAGHPALRDVTTSVLRLFGKPPMPGSRGREIFQ